MLAGVADSAADGCGDDRVPAAKGGDSEAVPGDAVPPELEPGVADPPEAAEGFAGVPEDAGGLPPDAVGAEDDEGDAGEATNLAAAADAAIAAAEAASAEPAVTHLCLSTHDGERILNGQWVKSGSLACKTLLLQQCRVFFAIQPETALQTAHSTNFLRLLRI